jgi:hypothetical protein
LKAAEVVRVTFTCEAANAALVRRLADTVTPTLDSVRVTQQLVGATL